MTKVALSPRAAALRAAFFTYIRPRLAADAQINDVPILLALRRGKSLGDQRKVITKAIVDAVDGKLAQDSDIEDVAALLDAIEDVIDAPVASIPEGLGEEDRDQLELRDVDDDGREELVRDAEEAPMIAKIREWLKSVGVPEETLAQFDQLVASEDEPEEVRKPPMEEGGEEGGEDVNRDRHPRGMGRDTLGRSGSRQAMDAAAVERLVTRRVEEATARARDNARAVQAALRDVRPSVGEISIACDSAADVYGAALNIWGHKTQGVEPSAYKAMFDIARSARANAAAGSRRQVAQDAAPAGVPSLSERFPGLRNVRVG